MFLWSSFLQISHLNQLLPLLLDRYHRHCRSSQNVAFVVDRQCKFRSLCNIVLRRNVMTYINRSVVDSSKHACSCPAIDVTDDGGYGIWSCFCCQVYQARLRPNGKLVAVKVQRPGVRAAMALDLFILRKLAGYAKSLLKLNTDLPVKSLCFFLFDLLLMNYVTMLR